MDFDRYIKRTKTTHWITIQSKTSALMYKASRLLFVRAWKPFNASLVFYYSSHMPKGICYTRNQLIVAKLIACQVPFCIIYQRNWTKRKDEKTVNTNYNTMKVYMID